MASLGLGAGLYLVHPQSPWPALAAVCAGTLVDLDHLIDLWVYQKNRPQGEKLMHVFDAHTWVQSFILLHGLEFIPLLAYLAVIGPAPWIWTGIFLGYSLHLLMDLFGNRCYLRTYFLTYRLIRKFDARYLWTDSRRPGQA